MISSGWIRGVFRLKEFAHRLKRSWEDMSNIGTSGLSGPKCGIRLGICWKLVVFLVIDGRGQGVFFVKFVYPCTFFVETILYCRCIYMWRKEVLYSRDLLICLLALGKDPFVSTLCAELFRWEMLHASKSVNQNCSTSSRNYDIRNTLKKWFTCSSWFSSDFFGPIFVHLQYNACTKPWIDWTPSFSPRALSTM